MTKGVDVKVRVGVGDRVGVGEDKSKVGVGLTQGVIREGVRLSVVGVGDGDGGALGAKEGWLIGGRVGWVVGSALEKGEITIRVVSCESKKSAKWRVDSRLGFTLGGVGNKVKVGVVLIA